jgi:uncharacterized membrane protein YhaH (DUF805 family)
MGDWFGSIRHGLANLARFSGRDDRATFWPYAGMVAGLLVIGTALVAVPVAMSVSARAATAAQVPLQIGGYHPELMSDFGSLLGGMSIIVALAIVLLAAAITRRLHDVNRRGFWALLPLPFLMAGFRILPELFNGVDAALATDDRKISFYTLIITDNLFYLIAFALLIVFLARKSYRGDNRFGPGSGPAGPLEDSENEGFGNRPPMKGPSTHRPASPMDRGGNWV